MLNDNTPNNNPSNFNFDTSLPREPIPEVLPVSSKLSKETEIDVFLDKMQKKKVSDEIRQCNREKKLCFCASGQAQEFLPIPSRSRILSEEERPQVLNLVIQPCNRSHKKKGMNELKHELFNSPLELDLSSPINHNNMTEVSETACFRKITYDSIDEASQANQEEILCWCLYWKDFRDQLDEIIRSNGGKFGEKKARSMLYDTITEQLSILCKKRLQELGLKVRVVLRDSLLNAPSTPQITSAKADDNDLMDLKEGVSSAFQSKPTYDCTYFRNKTLDQYPNLYKEFSSENFDYYGITNEKLCPLCKLKHGDEESIEADVVRGWSQDNVKQFLQRNKTDLELEENDIIVIYGQNVTGLVTLKNLDDKMDLIRSELGNVYESFARLEIAKINGSHYPSKFEVYDLNGLAQLSLPRKQFSNEKLKYKSSMYIQASHANKISNYIYNKKMKMKLKESILYIRSLPQNKNFIKSLNTLADRAEKALNVWEAHEKKSTSSENRLYLTNTKFLGVMLITSYIMDPKIAIENNHAPFDEVLELDIRGRWPTSYLDMKNISIEIGEIKLMTKNLLHGYRQLLIRLAVFGFAIEVLNSGGDKVADYRCNLVGILYVPKVPSIINIPSEWENGIKFPKGSNHTIKIVAFSCGIHYALSAMENMGITDCMANGIEMEQNIALLATVQVMRIWDIYANPEVIFYRFARRLLNNKMQCVIADADVNDDDVNVDDDVNIDEDGDARPEVFFKQGAVHRNSLAPETLLELLRNWQGSHVVQILAEDAVHNLAVRLGLI
ncbi:hypothetical protein C1645_730623 [Glomus cerebriforme]|uniref:Uncharacterized protein n=1 Tax=Glomus cerebriforme TaxID=658196 RepID=A0A397TRY7_9GLOM|nr:hypothetical protein C1645_730623 [Glomus cerebriforme]